MYNYIVKKIRINDYFVLLKYYKLELYVK